MNCKFAELFLALVFALVIPNLNSAYADEDCADSAVRMQSMGVKPIMLLDDHGKLFKLEPHIADNAKKRADGYQFICTDYIHKSSILFVYPGSLIGRFHMNNVAAPLDIGFFDQNGLLIAYFLMHTYSDGNTRLYGPDRPFQFALEAREGFFKEHNLSPGKARLVVNSLR